MSRVAVFLSFVILFLLLPFSVVSAAKKVTPITVSALYVRPKNVVRAVFGNLKGGASSVSYTLTYDSNGIARGVMGTFKPGKKTSSSSDLYLGTCSAKVCIQHKNVKNVKLEVVSYYTNGKSTTKTYKIKY